MTDGNSLGDAPIPDEYRAELKFVGRMINYYLNGDEQPERNGFVLLMFAFGEATPDTRCNYLSNAQRGDVVRLLTEQLAHFKRSAEAEARHD